MKTLFALTLALLPHLSLAADYEWKVTNAWTPALEKKFGEFVATLGNSRCRSLNDCLTSPASNPMYAARTPRSRPFLSDCADLPFSLRLYFAWMEGLPFDYVSEVAPARPDEETNPDIRYTKFGNRPVAWRSFTPGHTYDAFQELNRMRDSVSTAMYRMHFDQVSDFYPPALSPKTIGPGAVAYDPAGHAAIVYKIESDGRVRMMDAHPDNSLTRITYDEKFSRSRPDHGAGFKAWRPALDRRASRDLPGFSTEQFNSIFSLGNEHVSYYDYVRAMLSGGSLVFSPVDELRNTMLEACGNVHDREAAVEAALRAGIQNKAHPDRLPGNIYGTSGEWEDFSTPSRDARLKVAFTELRRQSERYVTLFRGGSDHVRYAPAPSKYSNLCAAGDASCFLVASLLSTYEEVALSPACIFRYKRGDGEEKKLSYSDVVSRLFLLSFDPYHCAELRWGGSGDELASCRDERNKLDWYKAEQRLRNQTERTYDARMDTDLAGTPRLGVDNPPDVDLWGYLWKLMPRRP